MKTKLFMGKILSVGLTLCMAASLLPLSAFATTEATETADFTAADGGAAALALLNQHKSTGAADSVWNSGSKTLTLKGINFNTAATTAVKLPAGTTVVLADDTTNTIVGGDAVAAENGEYKNKIFSTALEALGNLTVRGGMKGTGTLSVTSGTYENTGDAWTETSAISVDGDFTVWGGHITAQGGKAYSGDCAFSASVRMDSDKRNKFLSVIGGSLTAIGGETFDMENPEKQIKSFSRGVDIYRGSVSVTGDGKLIAKCDPAMDGEGLVYAIDISVGDLLVSNKGEVTAVGTTCINVSGGGVKLTGGKLICNGTREWRESGSICVSTSILTSNTENAGNIEVSNGTLEAADVSISIYTYKSEENHGLFTVTGGSVTAGLIYGDKKLNISGGTVQTKSIIVDELNLSDASLTVREAVQKFGNYLYGDPVIWCKSLNVNSGVLDAAWSWGEYTPAVVPADENGNPTPLVKISQEGSAATFNGGTTILNTGYAGNTVLKADNVVLGEGMIETGADESHVQKRSDIPVMFSAGTGDSRINEAAISDVKFDYQPGDAPQESAEIFLPEDSDKYEIAYECWEEMENGNPVAFWYSDESKYNSSMKRITQFEEGKSYMYSIELRAKDGYAFVDNCPVMVNNTMVDPTNVVKTQDGLFMPIVKVITPTKPIQPKEIDLVEIINATITFKDGDKPVFTGNVPDNEDYAFRCEWWSLDENTGLISTEPEWGGGIYKNKITAFEAGKTYHYGVYVTAYYGNFSPDAKLKINGQYVNYKRIGDDDNMQTMWLETDLTMTPFDSSHTHSYGADWKSDSDNHWHECSCGSIADKAAHDMETKNAKDATATEKGYTGDKVCKVCGYTVKGKEIPVSGTTKPTNPTKPDGNTDVTSPKTGDNSNLALWFAVLFISCSGVIGVTVYSRCRKLNKR